MVTFFISQTIKRQAPSYPYQAIKEIILGEKYELSLTFIGKTRARSLSLTYKNKDYFPNVLSFPLTDNHGEIFICPEIADREAADYHLSKSGYIAFLFIHGCLHLKGYDHSGAMEKLEQKYLRKFAIT